MKTLRLRHLARINPPTPAFERLSNDDELTFLPMEAVWPGSSLDTSHRRSKSFVASGFTRFQDGDILVPKITPTFEASRSVLAHGLLGGVGAGTTELHVVRPGPQLDPKFLLYITNTHTFLSLGKAEMYGVAGQQRVPDTFLRNFEIEVPPLQEQRHIVKYLDCETSRIDRLVRHRSQQERLFQERKSTALNAAFNSPKHQPTRLKYLLSSKSRYGVLVPNFVDSGVKFIRVNDLLDLSGRANSLPRIPTGLSAAYPRTVTRPGDILLSVVGTMGRSAVVPRELAGANVARAIASIRARPDIQPELICAWLTTPTFLHQAGMATASDTAQPTLGMEDLANFKLSWPASSFDQKALLRNCLKIQGTQDELGRKLKHQRSILMERRQALITAAVTGQFDVSTASGRNVTD